MEEREDWASKFRIRLNLNLDSDVNCLSGYREEEGENAVGFLMQPATKNGNSWISLEEDEEKQTKVCADLYIDM